jgi:hypothetical protein
MPESIKNEKPDRPRKPDPREVIDAKMATKICGLLALGYSQNMAAEYVGCDSSTITRTAKRDPTFHARLSEARSDASIEALRLIRHTGSQERYWRAAAWMLERRHPEEYGRRAPNTFTGEQMMDVLDRLLRLVMPAVPPEQVGEIMNEFEIEFEDVAEKTRMSLPEYEPEVDNEEPDEAAATVNPPRASENGTVPTAAATLLSPLVQPAPPRPAPSRQGPVPKAFPPRDPTLAGQGAVPPIDRLPPAMAAALADSGKRVSCLEQFVQRGPKAAVAGGRR